jgi:hypothetical protein
MAGKVSIGMDSGGVDCSHGSVWRSGRAGDASTGGGNAMSGGNVSLKWREG